MLSTTLLQGAELLAFPGSSLSPYEWVALVLFFGLAFALGMILPRLHRSRRPATSPGQGKDPAIDDRIRAIEITNRELEKRRAFAGLLSEISTRFITLPPARIDDEIPVALGRVARAIHAQRANIYLPAPESQMGREDFHVDVAYEWHDAEVGPVDPEVRRIYPAMFPWARSQYERGETTIVVDPSHLPEEAAAERELCRRMKWTSIAIIPLFVERRFVGNLNVTTLEEPLSWLPVLVGELRVVGEIFANALERKRQNERVIELRQDAQDAEERERTRIARELHDQLGGALTALKIQTRGVHRKLDSTDAELVESARRITEIIDETLLDVRRICAELRPAILDELELAEALEWQAEQFTKRTGIPCEFDLFLENHPEANQNRDFALFRIVQELLTNVLRHADASRVWISLIEEVSAHEEPVFVLSVSDNGTGFEESSGQRKPDRFGLRGVRERTELLGGEMRIETAVGDGTTVTVKVPERNGGPKRD